MDKPDFYGYLSSVSSCDMSGRRSAVECVETISETLETQRLVESVIKNCPKSPPSLNVDVIPPLVKASEDNNPKCLKQTEETCCLTKDLCELKRLQDFKPNTVECKLKSQIENVVPQQWESPMVQALRTVPDSGSGDPFSQIPAKFSSSALVSALSIALSEPFIAQPPITSYEPIPLPEETVPYFPPEHLIIIEPKELKPEKPPSQFVKALQTAPDRPFTPVAERPAKKKEDPTHEFFNNLPKPQGKLTMRDASDQPYSPLITESVKIVANVAKSAASENINKKNLQKPLKPAVLPVSFQKSVVDDKPKAPKPFPVTVREKIEEKKEKKQVDVSSSSSKVIEKHKTENIVQESVENVDEQLQGMYPLFTGLNCSFENKSEHSQFKIEISTIPPIIHTDRSQTPNVKVSRTGASTESVTETITEETKKLEKSSQESKKIEKQNEQIILRKPLPVASALHKADKLPQYQVNLSEDAQAELSMMEKMQAVRNQEQQQRQEQQQHQEQHYQQQQQQQQLQYQQQQQQQQLQYQQQQQQQLEQQQQKSFVKQQKQQIQQQLEQQQQQLQIKEQQLQQQIHQLQQQQVTSKSDNQIKPINTIQPGENTLHPEQSFKPVCEDKPPSLTFSSRPRLLTPSMINKPPPTIPYYQASLVAQECKASDINLLNPASPGISRSPNLHPESRRSPFPFPSKAATSTRAKSPALGPPSKSLKSNKPAPTPTDFQIETAQTNLSSYIPHHQEIFNVAARTQAVAPQSYCAYVKAQNISGEEMQQSTVSSHQSFQVDTTQKCMLKENVSTEEAARRQVICQGDAQITGFEQSQSGHLEQLKQTKSESVESSGSCQIQKKKTVTEEYEHSQKSKFIQIEKNVFSSKHPFRDIKNPNVEQPGIMRLHVTNPQPIQSPLLRASASQPETLPLPKPQPPLKQPSQPQPKQSVQPLQSQPIQLAQQPLSVPVKHVPAPSLTSPIKHVPAPSGSAKKPDQSVNRSNIPVPNTGAGSGGRQAGAIGVAPRRGRGVLNTSALTGTRIPLCASCHSQIRGPFITALGKIWCPDHFICATPSCRRPLQDLGFVEEQGQLYCEYCFEQYLAPTCSKCNVKVKGDCLKAIGKNFHPECFCCFYCGKLFGNSPFFLEDANPYCEADWNELFTTKCYACGFPVEAGDRWVEALNNNYHSQCFNCTMCKKNLEGQSFFAKGGRPFCKNHAR